MSWDIFISHASEDKAAAARPLAEALRAKGLTVWLDDAVLNMGDSLRAKIDDGLAHSRFGIVILSHSFFCKQWPQWELDGLVTRELNGKKVILPIWLGLSIKDVQAYSPILAGRLAVQFEIGLEGTVEAVLKAMAAALEGETLPDRNTASSAGVLKALLDPKWDRSDFYWEGRAQHHLELHPECASSFEVARRVLQLDYMPGLIRVFRKWQLIGASQSYDLRVDSRSVDSLENGRTAAVFVPPGRHTIDVEHEPSSKHGVYGFENKVSYSNALEATVAPGAILIAQLHIGFIGFRMILDPMSDGLIRVSRWTWA